MSAAPRFRETAPVFAEQACIRCGHELETTRVGFPDKGGTDGVKWRQSRTCRCCGLFWAVWEDGRAETWDGDWLEVPEGCLLVEEAKPG